MFKLEPKDITLESSNVVASTESEYDDSTTYSTGDTVKVSYDSDGTTERRPVKLYESLADSNTGNYPPDNPDQWQDKGSTNRWAMFDRYVNTQTENAESIEVKLYANKCSHFALFGLDATEIDWWLHNSDDVTIKSGTIDLSLSSPVGSVTHRSDIIQAVGAWVYFGDVEIHIKNPGSTARCGHCVIGRTDYLGETQNGVEPGILDYSRYITNDSGYTYLRQGNTAKEHDVVTMLRTGAVDKAFNSISDAVATPMVWQLNELGTDYEPLLTFAWWSKADFVLRYSMSQMRLRLKGMI